MYSSKFECCQSKLSSLHYHKNQKLKNLFLENDFILKSCVEMMNELFARYLPFYSCKNTSEPERQVSHTYIGYLYLQLLILVVWKSLNGCFQILYS